jgi:hypothetical protein
MDFNFLSFSFSLLEFSIRFGFKKEKNNSQKVGTWYPEVYDHLKDMYQI